MDLADFDALTKELGRKEIHRYVSYKHDEPGEGVGLSFGDLKLLSKYDNIEPTDYYVPGWISGSDYSGGSIAKANFKVFGNEFGEVPGVHELYGGHNSFGYAIRLDAISDTMLETFRSLENYPILDEDALSELQHEVEVEAWDGFYKREFQQALTKEISEYVAGEIERNDPNGTLDLDAEELADAAVSALSEDQLYEVFHGAMEKSNENWEHTESEGATVNLKRIIDKGLSDEVVEQLTARAVADVEWPVDEDHPRPPPIDPRQMSLRGVGEKKPITVGKWLSKGKNPIGLHVKAEKYIDGEIRTLLGTVKEVFVEDIPVGFSQRLRVNHFNGEPWPYFPLPNEVEII